MNEALVLGIAILALWIIVVYLRVPAIVLLSSILVGKLLAEELSADVYDFIHGLMPTLSGHILQVGLLILPVILTIVFLKGASPKSAILFNAIPLFFCFITLGLFINPYFDVVSRLDEQQRIILTNNQSYIVSLAGAITLLSAWVPHIGRSGSRGRHKHKY